MNNGNPSPQQQLSPRDFAKGGRADAPNRVQPSWNGDAELASVPPAVVTPHVRLMGPVNDEMLEAFQSQLANVPAGEEAIGVELMTFGGDADMGRRLGLEVRLARERLGRRLVFAGKTTVYSAGVSMMSGFAREDRFLSADSVLLLHCRQLEMTVQLNGPLRANSMREAVLEQIEMGLRVEQEGFAALVAGSDVSLDEVIERATSGWYLSAHEALERRLIAGIF